MSYNQRSLGDLSGFGSFLKKGVTTGTDCECIRERKLVRGAVAGDHDALELILRLYMPLVNRDNGLHLMAGAG